MIYSRKMKCHSAIISIVLFLIYFRGLSYAQETKTTYVGKGVPVRINGRDFQLFTLPDGKKILMLVTQDGGKQEVQTITNSQKTVRNAGKKQYRTLPVEKRKVLLKIRGQLVKIIRRRINPRKYRLITNDDGIPRLALNKRRKGGLTFTNIRKLIKLINSYLIRGIPSNDNTKRSEMTGTIVPERDISIQNQLVRSEMTKTIVPEKDISIQNQLVQTKSPSTKSNDDTVRSNIVSVKINQTLPSTIGKHDENLVDKLQKEEKRILNAFSTLSPEATAKDTVMKNLKEEEKQILSDLQALNAASEQSTTTSRTMQSSSFVKNNTTEDSVLIHSTKMPQTLKMNNPKNLMTRLKDEERKILLRLNNIDKMKTPKETFKSSFIPKNIGLGLSPKKESIPALKMEEKLLLMQLQKLRKPGEMTTKRPDSIYRHHGIQNKTQPTLQEERRLDRILSSFNLLLSTIEKEKILQMLYALDAGVGKGVGVRNNEIDVILRKLQPALEPGDYDHLLHLLGANGYRIQNIKPAVSSLESIYLSTLQKAKDNLPKDVQDLLQGIKHLLTKEEDDEINKLILETNGIISPSKEDMATVLVEAANAASKKASGKIGYQAILLSKVKALFIPNKRSAIVSQVQNQGGTFETNSLLKQIETLITSNQKQSKVSQTEANNLLAAIETAIKAKSLRSPQQTQANQVTDILKSIQHMLTLPQQRNLQTFLGGQQISLLPSMPPNNNVFGNSIQGMMVNPMNTMDSILMQNLILGDTTDPPDPTDPPPPNCKGGCKHQQEIEAEDLPPTTTTTTKATTTTIAPTTTTQKPIPVKSKPSLNAEGKSELALLSKTVIDALKRAHLPGDVKVELHLPKRETNTSVPNIGKKLKAIKNDTKPHQTRNISDYKFISGRVLNNQEGVVHIIASHEMPPTSKSLQNQNAGGRFRLQVPLIEKRVRTSEAIRSQTIKSDNNQGPLHSNYKNTIKSHNVLPNPTQNSFETKLQKKWWTSSEQSISSMPERKHRKNLHDLPVIDTLVLNDQYSQVILPDQFNPHRKRENAKFAQKSSLNTKEYLKAIPLTNDNDRSWRSNVFVRRNDDFFQTTVPSVFERVNRFPPTRSSNQGSFSIQQPKNSAEKFYRNTVTAPTRQPKVFHPTRVPRNPHENQYLNRERLSNDDQRKQLMKDRTFMRRKQNFEQTTTPSVFYERHYFVPTKIPTEGRKPSHYKYPIQDVGPIKKKIQFDQNKHTVPYNDRKTFLPTKVPEIIGDIHNPKHIFNERKGIISPDHSFHQNAPPSVFPRKEIFLPTRIPHNTILQPKETREFKNKINNDLYKDDVKNHGQEKIETLIEPPNYFSVGHDQHDSAINGNAVNNAIHKKVDHLEKPNFPRRMPPHPPEFRQPPSPRTVDDLAHLHHVQYEVPMTKMKIKDKFNKNTGINHTSGKNKLLRPLPNYLKVPTLDQFVSSTPDVISDNKFTGEKKKPVDLLRTFNGESVNHESITSKIHHDVSKFQENIINSTLQTMVERNVYKESMFRPPPPPPPPNPPVLSNELYETTTLRIPHYSPTMPPKMDWLATQSGSEHNGRDFHQHLRHQHHKRAAELAGKFIGDSLIVPIAVKSSKHYQLEHKNHEVQNANNEFGINNSLFNIKPSFLLEKTRESSLNFKGMRHFAVDKHKRIESAISSEKVLPPILDKVMYDKNMEKKNQSSSGPMTWANMISKAMKDRNLGAATTSTNNAKFEPSSTTISNDQQSPSFWNTLLRKINLEAPTSASNDGRPPVIHIHLPPPITKTITTTTKMPSLTTVTEAKEIEPIEAEDTTTTVKPTSSAVKSTTSASPSYKLQIHADENGVNKISIIQEAPENKSKEITNGTKHVTQNNPVCSPKSPLFYCQGIDVFQNVSSISAWCVGKCIQGECVKSVCNCSCHDAKKEEDSMRDDIALLFKGTGKDFSKDLVKMFKGLYDSLKGAKSKDETTSSRTDETKNPDINNVTNNKEANGPNEMKSLLSSIERLIDAKLHQNGFFNKVPEEVEAEDVANGNQNNGNGNNVHINSSGNDQNYSPNQNSQNFGQSHSGNHNWNNNNNNNNDRNNWRNNNGQNNWIDNNNGPSGNWNNNNNNNFRSGNNWQNGNNGANGWNNGNSVWNVNQGNNNNNGWSNGQMGGWNRGPPPPHMPWQGNSQGWSRPGMNSGPPQWSPWMSGPPGWQRGPQSMWGPGSMGMGGGMWNMGFGGMGKKSAGGEAAD